MKRLALLMAMVALALAAAAPAYASSAVGDTYGGRGGGIVGTVDSGDSGGPTTPAPQQTQVAGTTDDGSLPFTGLDVGLLALGGVALVGVGIGLRRFARPLS